MILELNIKKQNNKFMFITSMKKYLFIILFIITNISSESCFHELQSKSKLINENYEFSYLFVNNPFSQFLFINDCLFMSHIDIHSLDIPKRITRIVYKNEIHYPIIPSIKTIYKYNQKIEIREMNENYMYIIRSKDDTGLLIKYHFYKNEFWNLYMIEDDSI